MNKFIRWWVTPKLPPGDVFANHAAKAGNFLEYSIRFFSQWFIHPIKRRLARIYLQLLKKFRKIIVIGVTGSAGKSTTVQMLASILRQKGKTHATVPSIDPVYNIPNAILSCSPRARYLILEMSVEFPGEMDFYLWLAKPNIAVITNIYPTHTEFLGDVEGVLKEKGKLVLSLTKDNFAILNQNDSRLRALAKKLKARVVWFDGQSEDPLIQNAKAARKVAEILGIDNAQIEKGLRTYPKPEHRFAIIKHSSGATLFDDSYNSNPEALLSTLKVFNRLAKNNHKIAILGDMVDLGRLEEKEHRRVGRGLAKDNFDTIIGIGQAVRFLLDEVNQDSPKTKTDLFSNWEKALPLLKKLLKKDVFVLIKGSHSIKLDQLVEKLT